jgi:uncharacterized sulfatase
MFLLVLGCSGTKKENNENSPNIIFILSDDQSWPDYSFMGHPHIETPNIDQLAREGLTYTRGYLTAPVCSPSVASIITGLYPHQHGITGNDPKFTFEGQGAKYREEWLKQRWSLKKEFIDNFKKHPTLPTLLKEKGYLSFQSGKWWEGSWDDGGFTGGMTHGDPARGGRHGDEGLKIGREGMDPIYNFLDEAQDLNAPFFLWYAPFMPHTPHTPPDSLLQKYLIKTESESIAKYWAMCEWFDITVGQLLDDIEARGMTENTIVVYVCDNGWIQNPDGNGFKWPSKQSPYDKGIRSHITYKWPGHITPAIDTTTFVSSIDMVPTVLKAIGMKPTSEMQGIDVLNPDELHARDAVFSEDFHHDMIDMYDPGKSLEHRMIMKSPWKLIMPTKLGEPQTFNSDGGGEFISIIAKLELYHIVNDSHEKENVAAKYPEIVKDLQEELDKWWDPDL